MSVRIKRGGAVDCRAVLELPLSATSVWGQLRDFPRYARQDFFHAEMTIAGGIPRAGATLTLYHRYAGLRIGRVGRILIWREGIGYSFSDLSSHGPRRGFPHVFSYRVEAAGDKRCRLHICVRGKWTAGWIPKWAGRLWLAWVFNYIVRRIDNQLLIHALWRKDDGT